MNRNFRYGSSNCVMINDFNIKNKIIDFLFNSIDLSKYRYNMLNNIQRLKFLSHNEHYVSPNFKGYNYYLLFLLINKKQYCVAIDKRKMSYHKKQLDIKNLPIYKLNIDASKSIYRGTIFDSKLIRKDNNYIMLLHDCFHLMGNTILDMEMSNKLIHLDSIIKNQFNKKCVHFKIKINKLYEYTELENLIKNIIPNLTINCQGIIFFPKFSGITIIYVEPKNDKINITNDINQQKNETYHMIHNLTEFLKSRTYSYELEGKKKKMFLKKTEITDVYDIYENKDSDRLGIAHIPNLKISQLCKNIIKNDNLVKFLCIYNKKFKKWIPLNTC